ALGHAQSHLDHIQDLRDQAEAGAATQQSRIDDLLNNAGKPWCEDGQWDGPTSAGSPSQQPDVRQDLTDLGTDGSATLADNDGTTTDDGSTAADGSAADFGSD